MLALPDPMILEKTDNRENSSMHIKIYRNNMHFGLIKALASTYPVCERLLGKSAFNILAGDYVNHYPSTYVNLNDYGKHFAQFIQDYPPAQGLTYLSDVAKFECLIQELLVKPHHPSAFDFQAFASLPQDRYRDIIFQLRSDVVLFKSCFPIDKIWETNQDNYTGDDRILLREAPVYLLLTLKCFDLQIQHISFFEWQLLCRIQEGCTLEQLFVSNSASFENMQTQSVIANLIEKKLISAFRLKS